MNRHHLNELQLPVILNIIMIYNILNIMKEYNQYNQKRERIILQNAIINSVNDINILDIYCPICLEYEFNKSICVTSICGHSFHRKCIIDWINCCNKDKVNVTCPVCRSLITY